MGIASRQLVTKTTTTTNKTKKQQNNKTQHTTHTTHKTNNTHKTTQQHSNTQQHTATNSNTTATQQHHNNTTTTPQQHHSNTTATPQQDTSQTQPDKATTNQPTNNNKFSLLFLRSDMLCRLETHSQHTSVQYSLFRSAERTPRAWLQAQELHNIFVRLKRVCHLVSHICRLPRAHHLPHLLCPYTTTPRTRSTTGTTGSCTSPSSPSRQATPSRITLA